MANIKKYDYKQICKDRGLIYIREQNPYIWVKDEFGFTHRLDRLSLVRGSEPSQKSLVGDKTEYSIFMIKSRHPHIESLLDFDRYEYITALTYTKVSCKKHGEYSTKPNWIMNRGHHCMLCAEELRTQRKILSTDDFISRSKSHFGETYDYSKVKYVDCRTPVTIGCSVHGDFDIVAYYHSNGSQGCQQCGKESERDHYAKRHVDGASVYLIKLSSTDDTYYKIGLSSNPNKRLSELSRETGCKVDIIKQIKFQDSKEAWDTEELLLSEFEDFSYEPTKKFNGHTECFKFDNIGQVIKTIDIIT